MALHLEPLVGNSMDGQTAPQGGNPETAEEPISQRAARHDMSSGSRKMSREEFYRRYGRKPREPHGDNYFDGEWTGEPPECGMW